MKKTASREHEQSQAIRAYPIQSNEVDALSLGVDRSYDAVQPETETAVKRSPFIKENPRVLAVMNYLDSELAKGTRLKHLLASHVGRKFDLAPKKSLKLLGLNDIPNHLLEHIDFKYSLKEIDDADGTIRLGINIIDRAAHIGYSLNRSASGYLKPNQIQEKDRQNIQAELANSLASLKKNRHETRFENKLPSQIGSIRDGVSFSRIGLQPFPDLISSDILTRLTIVKTDDQNGELELEIELYKNGQSLTGKIVVAGYNVNVGDKSRAQAVLEHIENEFDKGTRFTHLLPSHVAKSFNLASNKSLGLLGINDIPKQLIDELDVKYEVRNADDNHGIVTFRLKITDQANNASHSALLYIRGYAKLSEIEEKDRQHARAELEKALASLEGRRHDSWLQEKLPSEIGSKGDSFDFAKIGLENPSDLVSSNIVTTLTIAKTDNLKGELELEVQLYKNGQSLNGKNCGWRI
ncbi:lipoprotein 17-related variable surface protein [Mycoplasma sp. ATU-Cv-508]|uniref:lipoprotein 17-related variable surface protein n=1 Tax=Mycoplasma sp. ATU-Cv-508 TaxID=2048001 RepID=UPI000FDE7D81